MQENMRMILRLKVQNTFNMDEYLEKTEGLIRIESMGDGKYSNKFMESMVRRFEVVEDQTRYWQEFQRDIEQRLHDWR